jgi:hypothetical protein
MTHRRVGGAARFWVLLGAFALAALAARAQSYGSEEQVLTIGAAEFRSYLPEGAYIDSDGYLYSNGEHPYQAPLALPVGALVEKVCVYANDSDPSREIEATLIIGKLVASGSDGPDVDPVGERATSTSDVGYGYYCSDPFSYSLRGMTDVDGDGIVDAVVYNMYVSVPPATQNSLGFGGVRITWRRQVSPPPPTPTFGDVPASDPGFQYIEALAASGITAGCAGGNYCPDTSLTRRQMAVFLAKALGLHWAD